MKKKKLGIDELLNALKNPNEIDDNLLRDVSRGLPNTRETWERIGNMDPTIAADVGIDKSELANFIKEWVAENPYNNI